MGKTLPPFSQLIEQERRRWVPFRRALLQPDQVAFDALESRYSNPRVYADPTRSAYVPTGLKGCLSAI